MSLPLYSVLKTWHQARRDRKVIDARAHRTRSPAPPTDTADAVVYAAGIACAGQVPDQRQR